MTWNCRSPHMAAGVALALAGLVLAGCSKPAAAPVAPPPVAAPPAAAAPDPAPATPPAAHPAAAEPARPVTPPEPPKPATPPPPPIKWVLQNYYGPIASADPAAKDKQVVLLTFDDGPHPEYTARILDTLKAHDVKALWFVTSNAGKYEDVLKRIAAEGHLVGTHTLYHENLRNMTRDDQRKAIAGANAIVERVLGQKPKYFRPPFGAFNADTKALMQELGMTLMNWDHGSGDWMEVKDGHKDPQVVVQDTLSEKPRNNQMTPLHPGAIILFHDTLKHTAEALPDIITGLKAKGYEFVLPEP